MLKRRKQAMGEPDVANAQTAEPTRQKPLRLWPGVVAAILLCVVRFGLPVVKPDATGSAILAGVAGGVAIVLWWVFLSRAPWSERLGAVVLMIVALFATSRLVHESIATAGMGMLFPILAIPILSLALITGAVASRRLSAGPRRTVMVAAILLACGVLTQLRTEGVTGDYASQVAWRWTETPEERLLSQAVEESAAMASTPVVMKTPDTTRTSDEPALLPSTTAAVKTTDERLVVKTSGKSVALPPAPAAANTVAEWPGFRGPERDGVVRGVQIRTDWAASPPVELWRRPIGPGWSSFAVRGNLFYTQEQRGDDEIVACYNMTTGEPVWMHSDSARFWESNGGAGPRGTPTLSDGRVYTFGGTGILNVLDAADGAVVWSRNAASDTKAKLPYWGFSSSPLVVDDIVIVATSGALIAYDLATGEPRWSRPDSSVSYSSPLLTSISGVTQVLTLNTTGLISVTPADGNLLWKHQWQGYPIVQPALIPKHRDAILISVSDKSGLRRLAVAHGPSGWTVEERWTSTGLKPYFNDFVVHKGHAFGFDGSILACIDLLDGQRNWKGGRYGHGQLVLLPDQDLLLVLSEQGELALVGATPDQFTELARFPAIEGKTWNHPVLVGDILLVRNGQEMAAFRLSLARS